MTNEERQLIIESIDHWEMDIVSIFKEGDSICGYTYYWKNSNNKVRMFSMDCPLCKKYYCIECLWFKYENNICEKEEYGKFLTFPILTNAQDIINKLCSIGLQDHSNKHFVSDYKYYSYN